MLTIRYQEATLFKFEPDLGLVEHFFQNERWAAFVVVLERLIIISNMNIKCLITLHLSTFLIPFISTDNVNEDGRSHIPIKQIKTILVLNVKFP